MLVSALPTLGTFALAGSAVAAGYAIFAIAGFGAALIAAPVLGQAMPVGAVVPILALLDCVAATANGIRLGGKIAKDELLRVVPLMVLGSLLGAYLLLVIPPQPMMAALGVFVLGYSAYGLLAPAPNGRIGRRWVLLFGSLGGVFSAMFGSGGPIYAVYLSRRLPDRDAFRATQTTLISFSAFTRLTIFALAGVYSDLRVLAFALVLAPAMLLGMAVGNRMTLRLSREAFLRVLYLVLIASGSALLIRALAGGGGAT